MNRKQAGPEDPWQRTQTVNSILQDEAQQCGKRESCESRSLKSLVEQSLYGQQVTSIAPVSERKEDAEVK